MDPCLKGTEASVTSSFLPKTTCSKGVSKQAKFVPEWKGRKQGREGRKEHNQH